MRNTKKGFRYTLAVTALLLSSLIMNGCGMPNTSFYNFASENVDSPASDNGFSEGHDTSFYNYASENVDVSAGDMCFSEGHIYRLSGESAYSIRNSRILDYDVQTGNESLLYTDPLASNSNWRIEPLYLCYYDQALYWAQRETEKTLLGDGQSTCYIYRLDLVTKQRTALANVSFDAANFVVPPLWLSGDYIYFVGQDVTNMSGTAAIFSLNLKTEELTNLCQSTSQYNIGSMTEGKIYRIADNTVYFTFEDFIGTTRLCSIGIDGSNPVQYGVIEQGQLSFADCFVLEEHVYFVERDWSGETDIYYTYLYDPQTQSAAESDISLPLEKATQYNGYLYWFADNKSKHYAVPISDPSAAPQLVMEASSGDSLSVGFKDQPGYVMYLSESQVSEFTESSTSVALTFQDLLSMPCYIYKPKEMEKAIAFNTIKEAYQYTLT